jgi:copper resistance protein B
MSGVIRARRLCIALLLASWPCAALVAQAAEHEHDHQPGDSAPVAPLTDADRAAARPPLRGHPAHDNLMHGYLLADRLELFDADPGMALVWNLDGWLGTDLERLWLRSEGAQVQGSVEEASLEALYGRAIAPWWDVVAGLRHDFRPGDGRTFVAVGIQGLAPQRFEIEATAYVGGHGHSMAVLEAGYELLLTNRLVLQPVLEARLRGKDDPARAIGAGLAMAEAGLRLRYEFTRRFAPYLGVSWERALGDTADMRRAASAPVSDMRFVAGLRTWF